MIKKIVLICVIILVATTIYTFGLPAIKLRKDPLNEPKISAAVMEYANTQMRRKCIAVPSRAVKWAVEEVEILSLEELPGPHAKRRIKTRLYGGYTLPGDFGQEGASRSFKQKCNFLISDKYPEGISVQFEG